MTAAITVALLGALAFTLAWRSITNGDRRLVLTLVVIAYALLTLWALRVAWEVVP